MPKETGESVLKGVVDALVRARIISDPRMVKSVVITVDGPHGPMIEVTSWAELGAIGQVMDEIVTKYDLVPRSDK